MGFLGWVFLILGLVWVLIGAAILAPLVLLVLGIKLIAVLIFQKIQAATFWRVNYGKQL